MILFFKINNIILRANDSLFYMQLLDVFDNVSCVMYYSDTI